MLSDRAMRDRMKNGWRMGRPFTECGNGSTLENTRKVRQWIPHQCEINRITSIADAGAGDMAWIKTVSWPRGMDYRPYDLFPRSDDVTKIDITTEDIPAVEAILCRMVLNHLVDVKKNGKRDEERIDMALERFANSADWLFATQFDPPFEQRSPQFARLDLSSRLGEPRAFIQDGHEQRCKLALWRL